MTLKYLLRMLQPFTISSEVPSNTDFYMEAAYLLANQSSLLENHVYIGKPDDLDKIAAGSIHVESRSLILIITEDCTEDIQRPASNCWLVVLKGNYRDVSNRVLEIFAENQILSKNLLQFREGNYGIQEILNILSGLGGAPTLLLGEKGEILFTSGGVPEWMERACEETIEFVTSKTIKSYFLRHLKCGIRIHGFPIIDEGRTIAYLFFLCPVEKDADYMFMLEFSANIILRHMEKKQVLNDKENLFETFISDLFKGNIDSTSDYVLHDRINHLQESHRQFLIPAMILFADKHGNPSSYIISQLKSLFSPCSVCMYKGNILLLFSSDSPYMFSMQRETLEKLLEPYNCRMAFSPGCYGPSHLLESYTMTRTTAELSFRININGCPYKRCFTVDDYRSYILIDYAFKYYNRRFPSDSIMNFCNREIYLLAVADHYKKTNYLEVLFAYLATNRSLSKTAEILFMNKNTVSYKLGKIKKTLGDEIPFGKLQYDYIQSYYICKYAEAFYGKVFETKVTELDWLEDLQEPFDV